MTTMTAPETTTIETEIPTYNLDALESKLEQIAKRARKLGQSPLTMKVVGTEVRDCTVGVDYLQRPIVAKVSYTRVEVTGEQPKIAGYTFAATVEHTDAGNIIKSVPGADVEAPASFRETGRICEHCNKIRDRKDTYLLRNDETGDWKQVGKTCLQDYLGCDVEAFLARLSWWGILDRFGDLNEEDIGWGGGHKYEPYYSRREFLRAVSIFVRTEGWVSRTKARESCDTMEATADSALWLIGPARNRDDLRAQEKIWAKGSSTDVENVQKTLEWIASEWAAKDVADRSEYEHNVVVAVQAGEEHDVVTRKTAGLVGSALFCYFRAVEAKLEAERDQDSLNEHFGEIGGGDEIGVYTRGKNKGQKKFRKGYELTLTISSIFEKVDPFDGMATYIHKLRDADGRTFTWFGSRYLATPEGDEGNLRPAQRGDTVKAVWSVKAHNTFKGTNETIINRPRNEELISTAS